MLYFFIICISGQNTTKPYGEHQDGSSMPLNATDTESVDSLGMNRIELKLKSLLY